MISDSGRSFGLSVLGVIVGREYAGGAESGNASGAGSDCRVLSVTNEAAGSTEAVGVRGFLMV